MTSIELYNVYKNRDPKNYGSYLTFYFNLIKDILFDMANNDQNRFAEICAYFNIGLVRAFNFLDKKPYDTYVKFVQMLGIMGLNEETYVVLSNDAVKCKRTETSMFDEKAYEFATAFYNHAKTKKPDFKYHNCLYDFTLFIILMYNSGDVESYLQPNYYNIIAIYIKAAEDVFGNVEERFIIKDNSDMLKTASGLSILFSNSNTIVYIKTISTLPDDFHHKKINEIVEKDLYNLYEIETKFEVLLFANNGFRTANFAISYTMDADITEYKVYYDFATTMKPLKDFDFYINVMSANFINKDNRVRYVLHTKAISNIKGDNTRYKSGEGLWLYLGANSNKKIDDPILVYDFNEEIRRIFHYEPIYYDSLKLTQKGAFREYHKQGYDIIFNIADKKGRDFAYHIYGMFVNRFK